MSRIGCWCGNTNLLPFSQGYLRCPSCETLVFEQTPSEISRVIDDEDDFYGRHYWFSHQEQLGYPDIIVRSRTDLPERCLYWLRTLLKYKLPPAKVLELGSGHGGFVAMLRWAGFDATGLELSSSIVDLARQTFKVPMLLGPIEDQRLKLRSLDVIVLMDVLEHLPDPTGTMRHCMDLLKPDGILVIQTPCYPEGKSYEEMTTDRDRFLEQLKANEHLYLFSRNSIRRFFQHIGANHLAFEPAIFAHYDMFLIASRIPIATFPAAEIEQALCRTPSGRIVQALLDLDDQYRALKEQFAESEADRAARLENMRRLERLLAEAERDRAARLGVIEAQGAEIAHLQGEVHRWLEENQKLWARVGELEAQRNEWQARWEELRQQFEAVETDRAARLVVIEAQGAEIARLQGERNILQEQLNIAQCAVQGLRASRAYRLLRRAGRWKWLEQMLNRAFPVFPQIDATQQRNGKQRPPGKRVRVAVDLTPMLPGGENGGAKLVSVELIRHLSRAAPNWDFVLLTSDKAYEELASLESTNVRRFRVTDHRNLLRPKLLRVRNKLWEKLAIILPYPALTKLKSIYRLVSHQPRRSGLLRQVGADLLFCPFTAPFFYEPHVPVVSIVHDLQYVYYPQFFNADERYYRDKHFKEACKLADKLVCVSEYVRKSVLENSDISPDRVVTIHTRLFCRLEKPSPDKVVQVLDRLGLKAGRFLLYPSNFWPHKNHCMLLTAFGMYKACHPESDLKLVCTGAPSARMEYLRDATERMGLIKWVVFPGYVPNDEFATLMASCLALIFPSLYEGFGMPVLEAMAFGKPVLCSNVTSLPEVAGNAALLFDPRRPAEIVSAIERIENDPQLVMQLVERGYEHLSTFGGLEEMIREYLQIFHDALKRGRSFTNALQGLYPDGWTGNRLIVTCSADSGLRHLEMVLHVPPYHPHRGVLVSTVIGERVFGTQEIRQGQTVLIQQPLPPNGGFVEFLIEPTFQPKAYGMNDDERELGCLCYDCKIVSGNKVISLREGGHDVADR